MKIKIAFPLLALLLTACVSKDHATSSAAPTVAATQAANELAKPRLARHRNLTVVPAGEFNRSRRD